MKYYDLTHNNEIEEYARKFSSVENAYLIELERYTHLHTSNPRMLSGWEQGRLLSCISGMLQPKRVLEVGTFTGYSALCLAEGLHEEGMIYTLDVNEEWNAVAKEFVGKSPFKDKINLILQDAKVFLKNTDSVYDLCFIDADKENYPIYYELCLEKTKKGGYIMADNVLWSGKVLMENPDKLTNIIKGFNEMVQNDVRVQNFLLPIRDGISIIKKL